MRRIRRKNIVPEMSVRRIALRLCFGCDRTERSLLENPILSLLADARRSASMAISGINTAAALMVDCQRRLELIGCQSSNATYSAILRRLCNSPRSSGETW
jgi:hypothetical protein